MSHLLRLQLLHPPIQLSLSSFAPRLWQTQNRTHYVFAEVPAHLLELRHLSNRISGCYQQFPYRRTNFCTLGHNDNFITALHYLNYLFIYNVVSTFTKASISLFFSPSINHVLKCYVNPVFIPLIINVYITGIWHRIGHIHFNNCR